MTTNEQGLFPELPLGLAQLQAVLAETPLILEVQFWGEDDASERYVFHRPEMLARFLSVIAARRPLLRAWRWDEVCRADLAFGIEVSPIGAVTWS